jgi:hypothetical protein
MNEIMRLKKKIFERLFISWAQGLKDEKILDCVIAIEGKTIRGSKDSFYYKSPLHSVHVWSVENGICLGQIGCTGL